MNPETAVVERRDYGHPGANVSDVVVPGGGVASTSDPELAGRMVLAALELIGGRSVEAD